MLQVRRNKPVCCCFQSTDSCRLRTEVLIVSGRGVFSRDGSCALCQLQGARAVHLLRHRVLLVPRSVAGAPKRSCRCDRPTQLCSGPASPLPSRPDLADKIISFCAFTYACLFYAAACHRAAVPAALVAGVGTVVGLSLVNVSDDLQAVMASGTNTAPYWIQTAMIGAYVVWLAVFYVNSGHSLVATAAKSK
jgi:hypothetical protein